MPMCPMQRRLLEQEKGLNAAAWPKDRRQRNPAARSHRIPSEMRSWKELELNLHRVPVDHVSKHVRITGLLADEDQIDVEGVIRAEERRSGPS